MATVVWTDGASDGNLNTVGNWNTGAVPTTADDAVIATGARDITAGEVAFTNLYITEGFKFNFGTASTALTINCNNAASIIDISVRGSFVKVAPANSASAKMRVNFASGGFFGCTSGTLASLRLSGGGVAQIESSCVPVILQNNGPSTSILGTAGTALTTTVVGSGTVYSDRDLTTASTGQGGKLTVGSDVAITSAFISGTLQDWSSGTIATLHLLPTGTYTTKGSPAATKSISNLFEHGGSTFENPTGGTAVTINTALPV